MEDITYPFTSDGVQSVAIDVPGWTWGTEAVTFTSARDAARFVRETLEHWSRYAHTAEVTYWGYDPNVYDVDDPRLIIGTDGYPDATATVDLDDIDAIRWEGC